MQPFLFVYHKENDVVLAEGVRITHQEAMAYASEGLLGLVTNQANLHR